MRLGRGAQMLALSITIKDVGCGWLTMRGEGQTPQKKVNMVSEGRLSKQNSVRLDIFEDALDTISAPFRTDMATSRPQLASLDAKQASGQHRPSKASRSSSTKVDLKNGLEECEMALKLFLNNKFKDALELLQPWAKDSMYHALGYSTIVVLQAIMTFEQQDIQNGISAMRDALQTCQKYRKKSTVVESFSSLLSRGSLEQMTEEEMHAEICYAECLLQKAALTFVQDENMINFIKGGLKIRTSYHIYKECLSILHILQKNKVEQQFFHEFEGGVKLGIGAFNLMLSLLPARIIRLLEFIGFSGNRELGLLQLQEGASGRSMRSPLCCLTILSFHTYISLILGTGEVNLVEAENLLAPFLKQFPNGSFMLFYHARIELLKGNVEEGSFMLFYHARIELLKGNVEEEMMYIWNGFPIVSKREDLSENLLLTIEKAETTLQNQNCSDYLVDDECLLKLLKGCCLKNLQRPLQAELCFSHVIQSENLLKFDHYLVPFTLFELAFLYKSQGDIDKAFKVLETARNNYKDYSMESRLHFRIQAALQLWRKPSSH
ncbi:Tetratricopeptide repeat protein 39B [Myotis brandtii]|uniref:Tetratricopeptide repeat protein 39B n=1 Tax=Myotis brandtii TaxID=109478 RepID=S7MYV6_MYOBR|nr:Tetratricopeptide repeat protein 39B [Myotis brandtii]